ncbi:glyoxylate reductase [Candidatus Nitrososphaera gargensis Ga9.2]|uniref:Glyoxylate reductase n=1 Tax=Nitrososphaera gargensis (strain Ga9.2) TaxID=1237085 RepID=K0INA5_NITGG|nr:D-glycerate dehydrogenase [Candidatus Nitrososphaera gargensis]AFU59034.1 glyoxylate reductase [Candidatus Nitrososphaera gargensis Ga9.2]
MSNKVYVTRKILDPALPMLSKECQVTLNKKPNPPSRAEVLKNVAGKDGILCMLSDRIDSQVMDAAGPSLKVVSSYSTGFEHIDIREATARGIYVTYTANILAEATADLTFALILACARNIVKADRYVRENKWKVGWSPDLMLGYNVHGATLGIIGLGRIGAAVARRAKGFNMKILYHNRSRNQQLGSELGARYVDLDDLLAQSDFVSIHTSLNSTSRHLIDSSKLSLMKKTAFLVNTARGQVVKEADLVRALKGSRIAGAALDVFENEPLSRTSPLLKMKNVVLLPHIGSATYQTRSKMAEVAARNLLDVLAGKEPDPRFLVNPEVKSVRPL